MDDPAGYASGRAALRRFSCHISIMEERMQHQEYIYLSWRIFDHEISHAYVRDWFLRIEVFAFTHVIYASGIHSDKFYYGKIPSQKAV